MIKNKQQLSLLNQLKEVENKGSENSDYLLLLERLCVLLKLIFETSIKNSKYQLYNYIKTLLSEEKFMQEWKCIADKNKLCSNKSDLNVFCLKDFRSSK